MPVRLRCVFRMVLGVLFFDSGPLLVARLGIVGVLVERDRHPEYALAEER